jgi:hypothetical protein
MARSIGDISEHQPRRAQKQHGERQCRVCHVRLSAYNPNPYCWQHMIGQPWRGPTAKPKF